METAIKVKIVLNSDLSAVSLHEQTVVPHSMEHRFNSISLKVFT